MKVILEFELPEEQEKFDGAINGDMWQSIAWDLDQFLRSKLKYEELTVEQIESFQQVRDKLYELLYAKGLDL